MLASWPSDQAVEEDKEIHAPMIMGNVGVGDSGASDKNQHGAAATTETAQTSNDVDDGTPAPPPEREDDAVVVQQVGVVVTPNAKQRLPRGRRHDASAANDPSTAAGVAEPRLPSALVPHDLSPLPAGVDPPGAIGGSAAGTEKKRAASALRPVGRSEKQQRSSSQNKKTAAASKQGQEQPTDEKKKKKKKLTWREKGAPGCSRCRYQGCGTCYVAITPTVVAPEVVEPGGSLSVVLVAPSNDMPPAAATQTKDHDDEKKKPPVAAAASPTRHAKVASAPTAIERRLLRIGRAASADYSRLLSLRSFPAESADGGHGLFLDGDQTELGLLLELQAWVDQKMCSVCHARMGMIFNRSCTTTSIMSSAAANGATTTSVVTTTTDLRTLCSACVVNHPDQEDQQWRAYDAGALFRDDAVRDALWNEFAPMRFTRGGGGGSGGDNNNNNSNIATSIPVYAARQVTAAAMHVYGSIWQMQLRLFRIERATKQQGHVGSRQNNNPEDVGKEGRLSADNNV